MRTHGKQILAAILALTVALISISGIPRFKNGRGLDGAIGGIGWFGGLLTLLLLLVLTARTILLARRARDTRSRSTTFRS